MRMPTDPPPAYRKVEMISEICEDAGTILGHPSPGWIVSFQTEMGRYVYWNKSNNMLVGQIPYVAGSLERKGEAVPP